MKKVLPILALLLITGLLYAFVWNPASETSSSTAVGEDLTWLSWDEMVDAQAENPRKVLVDVYTEWCGWCKKMDASTFVDPTVVDYLQANFYVVKFDAEQKGDIEYRGHTLKFKPGGRRGSHELAVALLNGRMSYPSLVYLDENLDRINISPGFKQAPDLMKELEYIADEHYRTATFQEYSTQPGN